MRAPSVTALRQQMVVSGSQATNALTAAMAAVPAGKEGAAPAALVAHELLTGLSEKAVLAMPQDICGPYKNALTVAPINGLMLLKMCVRARARARGTGRATAAPPRHWCARRPPPRLRRAAPAPHLRARARSVVTVNSMYACKPLLDVLYGHGVTPTDDAQAILNRHGKHATFNQTEYVAKQAAAAEVVMGEAQLPPA